jgi:hypothetical protein
MASERKELFFPVRSAWEFGLTQWSQFPIDVTKNVAAHP